MPVATQLLLSTVVIDEPTMNETVSTTFPACGTYSIDSKLGQGWVMWQVQPTGTPPSSTGWLPTDPQAVIAVTQTGEWCGDEPVATSQGWSCTAVSTSGSKTFYAAAFTPRSPNPVAIGSVDITVS